MMEEKKKNTKPVLWNSNYLKVWIANFMLFFAFYLLAPLLPLYLRDTFSAGKAMIGIVLSGYTITALIVRPFSGFVVDSFSRKKVLLLCYFCFALFFAGYFITGSLILFCCHSYFTRCTFWCDDCREQYYGCRCLASRTSERGHRILWTEQ